MKKRMTMLAVILLCGAMLGACGGSAASSASSAETEEAAETEKETEDKEPEDAAGENETEVAEPEDAAGENETAVAGENETAVVEAGEASEGNETVTAAGENETEAAAGEEAAGGNETEVAEAEEAVDNETAELAAAMVKEAEEDPLMAIPTIEGEYTIEDCVKLGEYKGLKLEKVIDEVTDEDIDTYISYMVQPVEVEDKDAVLEDGDTANLDFTGYLNDEPFDGGAGTDVDLVIGSGTFIPGFEEQMIGMKVGEERDLDLTFPENYGSDELAGQDVVFHVTLNAIKRMPELDDEWAKTITDGKYETLEAYRESIRDDMEEQNESYAETNLQNEAWNMIMEDSEVLAFPEDLLKENREEYQGYLESEAAMYGMTADDYIKQMGLTQEDFEKINEVQVRNELTNELLLDALVKAENITEDDPEYKEEMDRLTENYGMTFDEMKETYGEDVMDNHLKSLVVINRVLSYADITEVTSSEEEPAEAAE